MPLFPGNKLGPYEILAPLGAGGMGEVYRARDGKLNREVAIKVLPAALANDADYLARFQREAQVLASLNHPHIAQIYGLEENAIIMELVEGAEPRGPLPLDETLKITRQVAEALEAAHEKGIVHRDLKPANIKIRADGTVKVLDFGLAKAAECTSSAGIADSPTLTMRATQAGLILGTASYMAPEQAAGKPVDRRADIWSFGVVLWELLAGKRLFDGETISHTLADVLRAPIDLEAVPKETPGKVRDLLRRCLNRDIQMRLQSIGDARIVLQECLSDPGGGADSAQAISLPHSKLAWSVAGIAILAFLVASVLLYNATRPAPARPLMRLSAEIAPEAPLARANGGAVLALSPDGKRLALTLRGSDGKVRLYTRPLNQSQVTPLAGTEDACYPFFSPDGEWIGFNADGKLKKISVDGGAAVTLCDARALRGASWGEGGNIIAALENRGALSRVPDTGGAPVPVTKLISGDLSHRWPHVLPGGQEILFTASNRTGNYDDASIDVISLKTGERKTVGRGGYSPRYLASPSGTGPGHLVYLHESTLFAAPFDLRRLVTMGAPAPVLEDVNGDNFAGGDFVYSQNGTFVYLSGKGEPGWSIASVDSSGKTQPLHAPAARYLSPRFSPDGKRLAFSIATNQGEDIWVKDLDRDTPSRLSFFRGQSRSPVWTPDGKHIVFPSRNPDGAGIYCVRSDGSGEVQRLTDGKFSDTPSSFSPNGTRLAFSRSGVGNSDIFTSPVEGNPGHPTLGKPELFLGTPFDEVGATFSPDGQWLAYVSNESGIYEVYVRPFPGPGGKWQISSGGGIFPVWSRGERELLFEASDSRVMAVGYAAIGDSFSAAKPRLWTETRLRAIGPFANYDLAPNGKHLAAIVAADVEGQKPPTHLTFLLNFSDALRRRVGE